MYFNDLRSDSIELIEQFEYNQNKPVESCVNVREGKGGWLSISYRKRGYVVATDKQTNRPLLAKLIFILSYGYWPEKLGRIHYIDGDNRNVHIHNITIQFSSSLPPSLTNVTPSQQNKYIQWNHSLECWQLIMIHDGKYRLYGFFLTYQEAVKAYFIYCLHSNIPNIHLINFKDTMISYTKSYKTSLKQRVKTLYKHLYHEFVLNTQLHKGSMKKAQPIGEIAIYIALKL